MHHTMTIYLGSGGVAPRILNFATWWKWVFVHIVLFLFDWVCFKFF